MNTNEGTLVHIVTIVIAAAVLLGIPFVLFAKPNIIAAKVTGTDVQAALAASDEAPAQPCTILINKDKHSDPEELAALVAYFQGQGEPPADAHVDCVAFDSDLVGIKAAKSLCEGFPDGQMTLQLADIVIGFSKADMGAFDVIVVSDMMYKIFTGDTVATMPNVEVVHL